MSLWKEIVMEKDMSKVFNLEKDYWDISNESDLFILSPTVFKNVLNPFINKYILERCKILDFACGNGRFYDIIKDRNIDYYGIDINKKFTCDLILKIETGTVVYTTRPNLPFNNNYFDVCFCMSILTHLNSQQIIYYFSEFSRVLKQNGVILVSFIENFPDGYPQGNAIFHSKEEIISIANLYNLTIVGSGDIIEDEIKNTRQNILIFKKES